jgi:hypothetical protein
LSARSREHSNTVAMKKAVLGPRSFEEGDKCLVFRRRVKELVTENVFRIVLLVSKASTAIFLEACGRI